MTHERRRELGEGDEPIETELEQSFNSIVEDGAQRLHRTWFGMLATGFAGGVEIGIGVMGYLAVLHETGSHLLAGIPFSIGLVALLLAKSELFTESHELYAMPSSCSVGIQTLGPSSTAAAARMCSRARVSCPARYRDGTCSPPADTGSTVVSDLDDESDSGHHQSAH